ncbi:hypothetical protein QA634_10480 [Methylobacterium sp. CB376]|uniref:hypothetical protein n=1 Tax=unclassified Methylobacterium TaxID=2615210 RepID=UPI001237345B|nr:MULTISPECIES: hypothetical protein [Methylobacterium]WFT82240.1 hypothetical protein QA634_10480 [Methylobacterium nodulans]
MNPNIARSFKRKDEINMKVLRYPTEEEIKLWSRIAKQDSDFWTRFKALETEAESTVLTNSQLTNISDVIDATYEVNFASVTVDMLDRNGIKHDDWVVGDLVICLHGQARFELGYAV